MTDLTLFPSKAGCRMDMTMGVYFTPPPAAKVAAEHVQRTHGFLIDPYVLDRGVPRDAPQIGVTGAGLLGIGQVDYSDQVRSPLEIVTGAQARWLATDSTWNAASGRWTPYAGDASLQWVAGPRAVPLLDQGYSYPRRNDEVASSALIFDGSCYLSLAAQGLTSSAFSFGLVAVLQPGLGSGYSIVESDQMNTAPVLANPDETSAYVAPTDIGLRYNHGTLTVFAASELVTYSTRTSQQTPVVMLISMTREGGRLSVFDGGRATRTFGLDGVSAFDVGLFLGRSGVAFDSSSAAVMDLLEVDLFADALDESATEAYLNLMASTYGVV